MQGSKNSAASPSSEIPRRGAGWLEWVVVALVAAGVSALAISWFFNRGYTLYYGDAESHLNIARRILDGRHPGYEQIGTVWLPLPHLLMMPFAHNDRWWQSGIAGSLSSGACFVIACVFLFGAVRRVFDSRSAALATVALFALNPNLLYLQSAPMTEPVFFAALCGMLFACSLGARPVSIALAAICSNAASLTRYEGWFLIPFVALYFLIVAPRRRILYALSFGALASLAPLYWLGHNWYCCGGALAFYNGPGSAIQIYQSFLDKGGARYPGDHEWGKAILYFRTAAQMTMGWPLIWIGLAGSAAALWKRAFWPVIFLLLSPIFYILSMYTSSAPIFVPQLWPNGYYNTRYSLAVLPWLAFGAAGLVALAPQRFRGWLAVVLIAGGIAPWISAPKPQAWLCWKESQVNSDARREWTRQAAAYLASHYQPGTGILISFGDLTGILREAGIPIRESVHQGDGPEWEAQIFRPELFLGAEEWAIGFSNDAVSRAVWKASRKGQRYRLVRLIEVKGAQAVELYRRD